MTAACFCAKGALCTEAMSTSPEAPGGLVGGAESRQKCCSDEWMVPISIVLCFWDELTSCMTPQHCTPLRVPRQG